MTDIDILLDKFRLVCTKYKLDDINNKECGNELKSVLTDLNSNIKNEIDRYTHKEYELGYKRMGNQVTFKTPDGVKINQDKLKNMITIMYVFLGKKKDDKGNYKPANFNDLDDEIKRKIEELLKKLK